MKSTAIALRELICARQCLFPVNPRKCDEFPGLRGKSRDFRHFHPLRFPGNFKPGNMETLLHGLVLIHSLSTYSYKQTSRLISRDGQNMHLHKICNFCIFRRFLAYFAYFAYSCILCIFGHLDFICLHF